MRISLARRVLFIFYLTCQVAVAYQKEEGKASIFPQILDSEAKKQPQKEIVESQFFGHELFQEDFPRIGFSGSLAADKYLLGAGDKLGIFLSGKIQQNFEVVVNVEGKMHIPTVGVIDVQGLNLQEFNLLLQKKLQHYYDNFLVDVMLIEPKPVQVSVIGEIIKPGKYVLTALNTVIDAILLAGGPTEKGSLRNIQLNRRGQQVATVDLYKFLLKPEFYDENFLEPGDRIFVPLIESSVTTSGELKRTKIFELKTGDEEMLFDIIELAGGFTEYAYQDKIEISRLEADGNRRLFYVNYREVLDADSMIIMQNEDKIHVFSKLDQIYERIVYIHGEVKKPGSYVLEDNLKLSDLILKAGNLTRSAYTLEAEVAKIDPKRATNFIKVNLYNLFNSQNPELDIPLEEDDRVFIRRIPEWEVGHTVELKGEVMFPGFYSITKDSTRLSEVLTKAGGFTKDALIREAKLIRRSSKITIDKEYERLKLMSREQMTETEYQYLVMKENTQDIGQIVVDFYKLIYRSDTSEDVVLEDGDLIIVPRKPNVVYVTGRVARPGGVIYLPSQKLKYYLEKAGGAAWDAQVKRIKVTKVSGEILNDEDVREFNPGDIIWVPRKPDRDWWEVFRQTMIVFAQFATIYLVIEQATKK